MSTAPLARRLARSLVRPAGPERGRAGAGGGGDGGGCRPPTAEPRGPGGRRLRLAGLLINSAGRAVPGAQLAARRGLGHGVAEVARGAVGRGCAGARFLVRDRSCLTSDVGVGGHLLSPPPPQVPLAPPCSPHRPAEKQLGGWGRDGAGWTPQHAKSWQLLEIKTLIGNGWLEHSAPS